MFEHEVHSLSYISGSQGLYSFQWSLTLRKLEDQFLQRSIDQGERAHLKFISRFSIST